MTLTSSTVGIVREPERARVASNSLLSGVTAPARAAGSCGLGGEDERRNLLAPRRRWTRVPPTGKQEPKGPTSMERKHERPWTCGRDSWPLEESIRVGERLFPQPVRNGFSGIPPIASEVGHICMSLLLAVKASCPGNLPISLWCCLSSLYGLWALLTCSEHQAFVSNARRQLITAAVPWSLLIYDEVGVYEN